ncbi:MAG TPA: AIR synthase related protein [Acidimicrobiales bacterium]|nr:AIR synthase related protein [Acidimicrobiales bacterium]
MSESLAELAALIRAHPGVANKAPIALVSEVFGAVDSYFGPGDDGAVIEDGDVTLVVGGEALWPPFAAADPFGAGMAAVLANVNDLAAMGARPLAIVDTVVGPEDKARQALAGMRHASGLYQVPIVGGHLTVRPGAEPAISAFGLGRVDGGAHQPLSVRNAAPGQSLIVACCTDGTMRPDFNFFRSFDERGERLGGDVRVLASLAQAGSCVAAKDISMAGLVGSLAMLLEFRRLGVTVDLTAVPRPAGVALGPWLTTFPCFGFLLCSPPRREDRCLASFHARGLEAAVVGTLDGSGLVRLRRDDETETVFDLAAETVTGLRSRA